MNKCLAKDRYNEPCRCSKLTVDGIPTDFCKFHQYMNEGYTTEMLENLELCKGCNKMYYFGDQQLKTCNKCKERCEKNREKAKEKKVFCKKEGCKFKKSKENDYCLKHQICLFENEVRDEGKRLCVNYVRGCRAKLEFEYTFSKCENCLQKDRENDNRKRHGISTLTPSSVNNKFCSICCKEYPLEYFKSLNTVTKTCSICREQNKIQEAKRDREHVNSMARINDKKPERIMVKNEWKEKNYEKVAGYWMKSRQRLIDSGIEEYLEKNAKNARNWRDNNPEKVLLNNENKKQSPELQYNVYMRTANMKNLTFELSFDEYYEIVKKECYYCGEFSENKTINGIDRKDQTKGYLLDNCVSCCKMCNMMKKSLNDKIFLQRIEHILLYNNFIVNGKFYPNAFGDITSKMYYNSYLNSANNRDIQFKLTNFEFNNIIINPCYICGKQVSKNHNNGIDRFDSKIGYNIDNCRSCCGECNYMKNNYDYNEMIRKFICIYNNKIKVIESETLSSPSSSSEFSASSTSATPQIIQTQKSNTKEFNILVPTAPQHILQNKFVEIFQTLPSATPEFRVSVPSSTPLLLQTLPSATPEFRGLVPSSTTSSLTEPLLQASSIEFTASATPQIIQSVIVENKIMIKSNKKSQEEITKSATERKRLQRKRLKEKYGDEEYKRLHAQQIADNRKNRKLKELNKQTLSTPSSFPEFRVSVPSSTPPLLQTIAS